MITYDQIGHFLEKTQTLSSSIQQLGEVLMPVIQMCENIDRLNRELRVDQDQLCHEIRSVEVLGDILKQYVYDANESTAGTVPRIRSAAGTMSTTGAGALAQEARMAADKHVGY